MIKTIKKYIGLGTAILALSCGKDIGFEDPDRFAQVYMVQSHEEPHFKNLRVSADKQTFHFGAAFGGVNYPSTDIACEFKVAPELVATYNATSAIQYEVLPADSYTVSGLSLVIKAGELSSGIQRIELVTDNEEIDVEKQYMLPITLASISGHYPINEARRTTYFVLRASYVDLSKTGWEIAGFSSEEAVAEGANNGRAVHAIDDNINSFWHTQYHNGNPAPPHHIDIDMGKTQNLHGLRIFGRGNWWAGRPLDIEVLVSDDRETWQSTGDYGLNGSVPENKISFSANGQRTYTARYFRIVVNRSVDHVNHTCISDIIAF